MLPIMLLAKMRSNFSFQSHSFSMSSTSNLQLGGTLRTRVSYETLWRNSTIHLQGGLDRTEVDSENFSLRVFIRCTVLAPFEDESTDNFYETCRNQWTSFRFRIQCRGRA